MANKLSRSVAREIKRGLETAFVFAGGYGTRLGLGTKSLIEVRNRPLLDYTLEELSIAGVQRLIIPARCEHIEIMNKLVQKYDFAEVNVIASDRKGGTTLLPVILKKYIQSDTFFYLIGHAPSPHEHIMRMAQLYTKHSDPVTSLYEPSAGYKATKGSLDDQSQKFKSKMRKNQGNVVIGTPLLLTTAILPIIERELQAAMENHGFTDLQLASDDQFEAIGNSVEWVAETLVRNFTVRGVRAPMPVEFDYIEDFKKFLEYMERRYT